MYDNLNQIIDLAPPYAKIPLPPGEFEGPIVITKPLKIIGDNTTIWSKKGCVIEIKSSDVSLESIRAELTEGGENDFAVKADFPASAQNVEVFGSVSGFGSEDGFFDVPRTINLGEFSADEENTFLLTVSVPEKTEIFCDIKEIGFSPKTLEAGRNELKITVRGISEKNLLYAEALFRSQFIRRIYLVGKPKSDAPAATDKRVYTAKEQGGVQPDDLPKTDVLFFASRENGLIPPLKMQKGQRVALGKYVGSKFSVYFSCEKPRGMEIDPYVFLLGENDIAQLEKSLVFFGDERSSNGEAQYFPEDGHVEIDLSKVDFSVRKIVLAYSIYAGNELMNFAQTADPRVSIRTKTERLSFDLVDLRNETTAIAFEIFRQNGDWKISVVSSGFYDGLARLCNRFGIQVED